MTAVHRVDLPGLTGDEPLGLLAAIGLMDQLVEITYLSWDPDDRHAIVHCRKFSSVADLVGGLVERLGKIKDGEAIPLTPGFPIRRQRGAPDPTTCHRWLLGDGSAQVSSVTAPG
ncbi:MAG TPA: hypothetical protein VFV67_06150 [Actinophytocola sp.]|uniref:hypothetical protein n=1 Tax=Actinophytocola sp. TaxID=1872138 RepID=UPI002DB7E249|nr:hypothetical protein [Actinophytocola sp.]HEU5470215.1 hypothetical protein [Actinophytocola sp.]